ncbi:unnamed protein product [Prunus armeniaca]
MDSSMRAGMESGEGDSIVIPNHNMSKVFTFTQLAKGSYLPCLSKARTPTESPRLHTSSTTSHLSKLNPISTSIVWCRLWESTQKAFVVLPFFSSFRHSPNQHLIIVVSFPSLVSFAHVMLSNGFKINKSEKLVYVKSFKNLCVIVCLYIDDILIMGN